MTRVSSIIQRSALTIACLLGAVAAPANATTTLNGADCDTWNQSARIEAELNLAESIDQLIPTSEDSRLHDLDALASLRVSPDCALAPEAREGREQQTAIAELKCEYFKNQLARHGACHTAAGLELAPLPPADWDPRAWEGEAAWNQSLSALPEADRCGLIRQAMLLAISQFATERSTIEVYGFGLDKSDPHGLIIRTAPQPGHLLDRTRAAWILRRLHFTSDKLVPVACKAVKQEGEFRWIEALNLWEETYPEILGRPRSENKPFGRQPLGYAIGMCTRSNNAHFIDKLVDIVHSNTDAAAGIPVVAIEPELKKLVNQVDDVNGANPWTGNVDWEKFLEPLRKR